MGAWPRFLIDLSHNNSYKGYLYLKSDINIFGRHTTSNLIKVCYALSVNFVEVDFSINFIFRIHLHNTISLLSLNLNIKIATNKKCQVFAIYRVK